MVIFLLIRDVIRVARVATPVNAMTNIVELIEMSSNVTNGLIDLLVGVGLA